MSPANSRRWVSDDRDSKSVDCCHLVFARELAPQNPPHSVSVLLVVVVVEKKVFSHPTVGGVILRLGTLPEPWESENTSEDLRRS